MGPGKNEYEKKIILLKKSKGREPDDNRTTTGRQPNDPLLTSAKFLFPDSNKSA